MKKHFIQLKNPIFLKTLLIFLVVVLTFVTTLFIAKTQGRVAIDNSLVSAPIVSITPTVPGKLLEMDVYENQFIHKGDRIAIVGSQTLYADTDGLVIMANNQIGSLVNSQNPVVQLIEPVQMRIAGTLDENKGLSSITLGQVVSFTIDALPGETFWGYVDEIAPTAKQTQIAFSISSERPTQQFVVYAAFDATKYPQIKNGMSAKMTIYTK